MPCAVSSFFHLLSPLPPVGFFTKAYLIPFPHGSHQEDIQTRLLPSPASSHHCFFLKDRRITAPLIYPCLFRQADLSLLPLLSNPSFPQVILPPQSPIDAVKLSFHQLVH